MPARTRIALELTAKEADALWTAANNGRNDFLCDRETAKLYFGSPRGIGNANRAIDKLAKASRGKIELQPLPASNCGPPYGAVSFQYASTCFNVAAIRFSSASCCSMSFGSGFRSNALFSSMR